LLPGGVAGTGKADVTAKMPEVLEITVVDEQQLFNSMDPAPFRKRELDAAVIDYIVAFAENAPRDADLKLLLRLSKPIAGADAAAIFRDAKGENFRRLAAATRRKLRRLFRDGRVSLVIGLGFVALAIAIGESIAASIRDARTAQLVADSFVIGAWVALWHPLNIFLFEWWPLRREAVMYDRLSMMPVEVVVDDARLTPAAAPGQSI
jgi:hypothetical protein